MAAEAICQRSSNNPQVWALNSPHPLPEGSGAGHRGGLSRAVRHAPTRRGPRVAKRQWPDLSESAISPGVSRRPSAAGVHYALYTGTKRDDRAVFSEPQRRVCLAACLSDLRGRPAHHPGLGPLVQPRTATQRPGLSEPRPIPGATSNSGGLISGEHYRGPLP